MRIELGIKYMILLVLALHATTPKLIAQEIIVNTSTLEGLDITPDNMWGFQVQSLSSKDIQCRIDGSLVFRSSGHFIKFSFPYTLRQGINLFDPVQVQPTWNFSSQALRELFTEYKVLPQGTYQYCITLTPNISNFERGMEKIDDCIYQQSKDIFSITLLEPENAAKIREFNPLLSWVATYPFVNQLSYRIRVAEIKQGQNVENAIARNNPVYSENNLTPNSIVYPIYAKPLKVWQPYAWTVDAYYKGILLGGAQPWKFTIIEDSVFKTLPQESSYIDINIDEGVNRYNAVGTVKIKYSENDFLQNEMKIYLVKKGQESKQGETTWQIKRGENFFTYDLIDFNLTHNQDFEVVINLKNVRSNSINQVIKFTYVNPDFVK